MYRSPLNQRLPSRDRRCWIGRTKGASQETMAYESHWLDFYLSQVSTSFFPFLGALRRVLLYKSFA